MTDSKDDELAINLEMILEAPPEGGSPAVGLGSSPMSALFGDDSQMQTAAKFTIIESFFKSLTKDQGFGDFMRDLLLTTMKVVKSEAGSILEVDHHKNALFFRTVVGSSSDLVAKFVIPMGQGIVGHVAESRRPLIVSDVSGNERHVKEIQDAVGFKARNLVALPIIVRGRIYGVMELLNRIGESEYSPTDVEFLTYVCEMAAKAIEIRLMISWSTQRRTSTTKVEAA